MAPDPRRARTAVTRPILAVGVVAVALLLTACTGDEPVAGDTTTDQAPPPSTGESSAPPDATTSPPEPVLTLVGAPFSGYVDVRQEVVEWRLACSEVLEMVPDAVTMGTAEKELLPDGAAGVVRQVAVFASADAASAAADELGTYAREQCPDDSVMSTTEVGDPRRRGAGAGRRHRRGGRRQHDGAAAPRQRGRAGAGVRRAGVPGREHARRRRPCRRARRVRAAVRVRPGGVLTPQSTTSTKPVSSQ